MAASISTDTGPKWMYWAGWVLSVVPALMLVMSGVMKVTKSEAVVKGFADMGWPESVAVGLGIVELVSTALYLIPRTCVLGAILLTGYLGGAIATHVRMEDAFLVPAVLGVVVWGGLYLRESRIRALLPLRS